MVQASDVKKLRDATGAGILDCKKALEAVDGDYDKAYRHIREQGKLKAEKKSDRIAANGVILTHHNAESAVMLEVNCETDFVARNEVFQEFTASVIALAFKEKAQNLEALLHMTIDGITVEQKRMDMVASIGENIILRRYAYIAAGSDHVTSYQHGTRIGVLVRWHGGDVVLGDEVAMHIAASAPMALHASDISPEVLEQERSIAAVRVAQMGKSAQIAESIVNGMVAKFVDAHTLGGQDFIMDAKLKVNDVLQQKKARVEQFIRFELGEGIEKIQESLQEAVDAINNQHKDTE